MKFSDDFHVHRLAGAIALAIIGINIVIAFVLLCGEAQACENIDCKPDAVREWNGDTSLVDWPCGRTDTVVTEPPIDTVWPAIGVGWGTDITDTTDWALYFPSKEVKGTLKESIFIGDTLVRFYANNRLVYPERWYVKSVDTIHFIIGRKVSDCFRIDTTWAKKVSLADVYLTPNQVLSLMGLIGE